MSQMQRMLLELQQQVASHGALLNEERRLRQELEVENRLLKNREGPRSLKLPEVRIDAYDGKSQTEVTKWLKRAEDILRLVYHKDLQSGEVTEMDLVKHAVLYLTHKARASWDFLKNQEGETGGFSSWADFAEWLTRRHGNSGTEQTIRQQLLQLNQTGPRVRPFITKWQELAQELSVPIQDEDAKAQITRGLQKNCRNSAVEFMTRYPTCSLSELLAYLETMDVDWGREAGPSDSSRVGHGGGGRRDNSRQQPQAMDIDRLAAAVAALVTGNTTRGRSSSRGRSPGRGARSRSATPGRGKLHFKQLSAEQRLTYRKEGRCYDCGEKGHMRGSPQCRKAKN